MPLLRAKPQPSCKMAFLAALACLSAMAADRIVDRVDPSRTVTVKGQIHPLAQPRFDRGAADPSMELSYATVLLKPAGGLEEFLAQQQTASSANYHRWLTPEEFGARFGLSDSDAGKVVEWLRSQGLQVHDVARGRHWITFSGTAETVGRALHTEFRQYLVKNAKHFANATDPSVPAALEDVIAGFAGLNDFNPQPTYVKGPALTDAPDLTSGSNHFLAPDDIATIYGIAPLYAPGVDIDGAGQTIGVMGQTAINLPDIAQFRTRFGLAPNVPQILLYGDDPGIRSGDLPEADIDIEWSGAVARNATIIYVYSSNVFTSAQYAVDQNIAPVITMSYFTCESETTPAYRAVAQQANAQGITWMASSGDQGAGTCDYSNVIPQASKGPTLNFPADLPEITAVGGTTFSEGLGTYWASSNSATLSSALGYIPEKAWNDSLADNGLVATGGGASLMFAKPYWQTGPGVPADNARDLPDLSLASSANHDGYEVVTGGSVFIYGGTSVACPEFAGVVALLNQYLMSTGVIAQEGLGNINPQLYRLAQATTDVFHDITVGDNKVPCLQGSPQCVNGLLGYSTGPGYDLATGLGSIDATNLVTEWNNGTASTTSLTASPVVADVSSIVTLTATVSGGGKVAPTGTITFIEDQVAIGSAALTASGSVATATLSIPEVVLAGDTGVVVAVYAGDGVYGGSSATVTVQLNVPVPPAGSLVVPGISPNPVYQRSPTSWPYVVRLTEMAGVATKLTGFVINGSDNSGSIVADFGTATIPAHGTIAASLTGNLTSVPLNRIFVFSGVDAGSGQTWSQQITVPFLGPPAGQLFYPSIAVSSTPTTVEQNPQADPSCQWPVQLVVNEQAGFPMQLTKLTAGTSDLTTGIQQIFGTTRLAAWGALRGTVCWPSGTAPASKTLTVTAVSLETGIPVSAAVTATLEAAFYIPGTFTVSPASVTMQVSDPQHSASASLTLGFSGGSPQWFAAVTPASTTTNWLVLSQASGTGAGQLNLTANGAGLSVGVYSASVSIQSTGVIPQYIVVPVTFVVGPASATQIGGVANNASFATVFAPGMQAAVFGTALAPGTLLASRLPLPLSQLGVTAAVNGNSAPFYYVSPGQLNIQIPYETGSGPAVLAVNNNGQIAWFPLQISTVAPGLYGVWDIHGQPATTATQGQVLLAFTTGEGDLTPTLATGATPASGTAISKLPAARQPIAPTVGSVPATPLLFAGVPIGLAGVTQIDFTVPANAPLGPQPVVVTVGGVPTNTVTLNITAAGTEPRLVARP